MKIIEREQSVNTLIMTLTLPNNKQNEFDNKKKYFMVLCLKKILEVGDWKSDAVLSLVYISSF